MKTRLLIIIGFILIFGVIVVTDISQNQLEWNKVMQEDIHDPLQMVLNYCNDTSRVKNAIHLYYVNETHSIENNDCTWKKHQNFPSPSSGICIPYVEKWVLGEDWNNGTHYFDIDSCKWRDDPEYDALNSKGCPQFCPKESIPELNVTDSIKIPNVERDAKLAAGYKLYPGVGWIHPDGDSIPQNITRVDDGHIYLYPENMCASITLELLTEQDIQRYQNDEKELREAIILQITSEDFKEIPDIQELIYAVHLIEFPYNKHSSAYLDGLTFVEYEFFLMEKAIEKYGDSPEDYFMKLDKDYEEKFTNPAKQGLTNHFEAPVIIYNDNIYSVDGTNFWTSDEHEPRRMGVYPNDSIEDDEKFITLTDEDMKSVPEIKEAIESIGTIRESISANKGMPEDQWNEYREWFAQKSQERLYAEWFRVIQYDDQFYSIAFGIC